MVSESEFWVIEWGKIPPDTILRVCPLSGPILRLWNFRPFGIFSWKNIFCENNTFNQCFDKTPLPQWSYELCDHFMFLSKTRFTIVIYSRKFDFPGTPPKSFLCHKCSISLWYTKIIYFVDIYDINPSGAGPRGTLVERVITSRVITSRVSRETKSNLV